MRIANFLVVSVYFPCVGNLNRQSLCEDLLAEIGAWCGQFQSTCDLIMVGDSLTLMSIALIMMYLLLLKNFLPDVTICVRCADMFPGAKAPTYVTEALNRCSTIDYIVTLSPQLALDYHVTDPDSNFSDHLPVLGSFCCNPVFSHVSGQT